MPSDITIVDTTRPADAKAGRRQGSVLLDSRDALYKGLGAKEARGPWLVLNRRSLQDLVRAVADRSFCSFKRGLVSWARPSPPELAALGACFHPILPGAEARVTMQELSAILSEEHPEDYCVAVDWDPATEALSLWRGDLSSLVVPLSSLSSGIALAPDPDELRVLDHGQTIRLGEYECSVDAILYLRDAAYRRRARRRLMDSDRSLGGSIRRLRKQKGLRQSDFPHVAEKTITRIEMGMSPTPHRMTLERIARALGVPVEELDEY